MVTAGPLRPVHFGLYSVKRGRGGLFCPRARRLPPQRVARGLETTPNHFMRTGMIARPAASGDSRYVDAAELKRVASLLREIEEEAARLVEGVRGASTLAILGRAASARRYLESALGEETPVIPVSQSVERDYLRRIRVAVQELQLSVTAAANRAGGTVDEMERVLQGVLGVWPLDLLEGVARRLEEEHQIAMHPL